MNQELQQNRTKRFLKAIGLYAIGNLGSKLITFLMVPLYTYFVDSADYGLYDLYLTLVMALIPVMILQLRDGAFRFMIDNDDENRRRLVVTFTYKVVITTSLILIALGSIFSLFHSINYMWYAIALLIVMSFYEVVTQMVRGIDETVCFVQAGIMTSIGIGVFSVLFLIVWDLGVVGIFLANIVARIVSMIYIEFKTKMLRRFFTIKPNYGELRKEILKYSLPLLPGVLCWSLLFGCDRFFVEHFLGLKVNGQYAVVARFASIIQTLGIVFFQAWQEIALIHYKSKDRDVFFSRIFNLYIYVLLFIAIMVAFVVKINYGWLVDVKFQNGVGLMFPFAMVMVVYSLSNFMDLGYQCTCETKRTLPALIVASMCCIALNYLLVPVLGMWGAVSATLLSQLGLCIYRGYDVRRYFKLSISRVVILPMLILIVSAIAYYLIDDNYILVGYLVVIALIMIIYAPAELKNMVKVKLGKKNNNIE